MTKLTVGYLEIWRTSLKMVLKQHQYFGQSNRKKERERRKEKRKKESHIQHTEP
jgi:hypothetical protein